MVSAIRIGLALIGLAVALSGCGGEGPGPGESPGTTGAAGDTSTSVEGGELDLVDQATVDLATRLGVSETDIELILIEEVTWPDGSLGCPEPGQMYTQALVEGHRIVLGHGEGVYLYHSGGDWSPFLCPNPDSKDGAYEFVPPPGDDTR